MSYTTDYYGEDTDDDDPDKIDGFIPELAEWNYPLAPPKKPHPDTWKKKSKYARKDDNTTKFNHLQNEKKTDHPDKGYFELESKEDQGLPLSSRIPGFWDPDEDIDDTIHFIRSGGAEGSMDWEYLEEQKQKKEAADAILRQAQNEYSKWSQEQLADPCLHSKLEFDTCIKMYRHAFECTMHREDYSRCKNEFITNNASRFTPKKDLKTNTVALETDTPILKMAFPDDDWFGNNDSKPDWFARNRARNLGLDEKEELAKARKDRHVDERIPQPVKRKQPPKKGKKKDEEEIKNGGYDYSYFPETQLSFEEQIRLKNARLSQQDMTLSLNEEYRMNSGVGVVHRPRPAVITHRNWEAISTGNLPEGIQKGAPSEWA